MLLIFIIIVFTEGSYELPQIISGKDSGTYISPYISEGTPLQSHNEKHRIKGFHGIHAFRKKTQSRHHYKLQNDTAQTEIYLIISGKKDGSHDSQNKQEKGRQTKENGLPVSPQQIDYGMDQIRSLRGAENFTPVDKSVGAHKASGKGQAVMKI